MTVLLPLATSPAFAQDGASLAQAYTYAAEGLQSFDGNDPAGALAKFSLAYAIVKLPSIALFMARAEAKLGHLRSAVSYCDEAVQLDDGVGNPEVQRKAREEAKAEHDAFAQRIPRLFLVVRGASDSDVEIRIDSAVITLADLRAGFPVDPGQHTISALSRNRHQQLQATLLERESKTIALDFSLAPVTLASNSVKTEMESPERESMRTAAWISFGVGGAALALWGTTGLWAMSKSHDLDQGQPWSVDDCGHAADATKCNDYHHLRTVSTIGFYTGLAAVATGTTLFILTPRAQSKPVGQRGLSAFMGLGNWALSGTF